MRAWIYAVIAVFLWCLVPVSVKEGTRCFDWSWLLVLRFLGSSCILSPVIMKSRSFWKERPKLLATGVVLLGLNYGLQTLAMIQLPVSIFTMVFGISPLLCGFFNRTLIWTPFTALGTILSLIGTWLALGTTSSGSHYSFMGLICVSGGLVTWALVTRWMKNMQAFGLDAASLSSSMQLFSLLGVLPIWVLRGCHLEQVSFPQLGPLIILSAGIPLAFYFYSLALRLNARVGISSQYLEPIIGSILGVIIFSEVLTTKQIFAGICILSGLAIQELNSSIAP